MALQERVLGPDSLELAQTLGPEGSVLNRLARLDEAKALLERGVAIFERRLGKENPMMMGVLASLGMNAHLRDDHEAAFQIYDRMLRIGVASYGADMPRLWVPMNNAAVELAHLDRTEDAWR